MRQPPNFWTGLWVESSKSGDQAHYQERVEAREIKGGLLVHTVVTVWGEGQSVTDSLVFIPGATIADLQYDPDAGVNDTD